MMSHVIVFFGRRFFFFFFVILVKLAVGEILGNKAGAILLVCSWSVDGELAFLK